MVVFRRCVVQYHWLIFAGRRGERGRKSSQSCSSPPWTSSVSANNSSSSWSVMFSCSLSVVVCELFFLCLFAVVLDRGGRALDVHARNCGLTLTVAVNNPLLENIVVNNGSKQRLNRVNLCWHGVVIAVVGLVLALRQIDRVELTVELA